MKGEISGIFFDPYTALQILPTILRENSKMEDENGSSIWEVTERAWVVTKTPSSVDVYVTLG